MHFQDFVEDDVFSPVLITDALRTTKAEIAGTLGLGEDAFTRASRIRTRKAPVRLRQMLEILNRVEAETGSRQGKTHQVLAYLDRILAGGYA